MLFGYCAYAARIILEPVRKQNIVLDWRHDGANPHQQMLRAVADRHARPPVGLRSDHERASVGLQRRDAREFHRAAARIEQRGC